MDSDPAVLVVLALATFRLTRLAVEDTITEGLRDWVAVRSPFISKLLDCYWCASVWLAFPLAAAYYLWPEVTFWLSLPLALSAVAGLLSILTDR